jgi:hypothetical protein
MIHFYDSNTGKLLYTAPKGRTLEDFLVESRAHGWPSFRGTYFLGATGHFSNKLSFLMLILYLVFYVVFFCFALLCN